jgi:hypothetical protein
MRFALGRSSGEIAIDFPPDYPTSMIRAYEEIADLIASGGGPEAVVGFQASATTQERVAELIAREKSGELADDERSELDQYMQLEHVMRLAKARAQARLSHE